MSIEMTRNRLESLGEHTGTISIEGEDQNEIVIRIPFDEYPNARYAAEVMYNYLLDVIDDRCINCGRYCPEGLRGGLCEDCWN